MFRGGCGRRGRLWALAIVIVMTGLLMMIAAACGGGEPETVIPETTAGSAETSGASEGSSDDAGVAMAKEIFAVYDEMNAKVVELANAKSEPAVLKPQLEELYASYMPKMEELKAKYLALQESDEFAFRSCNGYVSTNRGQRITDMQNDMVEAIKYYNFELGDQEIVSLLTEKPLALLKVAINES